MPVATTSSSPSVATSVRWIYRRKVDAAGASHVVPHALNLWFAAAATEETFKRVRLGYQSTLPPSERVRFGAAGEPLLRRRDQVEQRIYKARQARHLRKR